MKKIILLTLLLLTLLPLSTKAQTLTERLSGQILLDVEKNGEAWYVYPVDNQRYYLGRPADAFDIMRELGLGISETNFQNLRTNRNLAAKFSGRILLQVEKNGEAWYINPTDLKLYYLGRPADAFEIMRNLGLGITSQNLTLIPQSSKYSKYENQVLTTTSGMFEIDVVEIDLTNPTLEILTVTADTYDCDASCQAKNLQQYVTENNGFAAINGSYFCAYDNCGGVNYYYFPVFNSKVDKMINEYQLKYPTTGPIVAFDTDNKFYYFKDSRDFESVKNFESKYGILQAAIGNKPILVEHGINIVSESDLDSKQLTVKSNRGGLGYKNNKIYLIVAKNATVPDLAQIMVNLNMEFALNLDGGYSSALIYENEYKVGPGRDIPNAIVFKQ
ncbi:hypothetical protein COT97_02505 [Candidatus Falkowbacteria bacterium CG10_big_fil_rev_8_21_14_0_10_39_11]|uniref:Phosphodiester glycosidase domain-containing protein n=1 Tax=Candidatus Falkowbacteria bacterium CG10_big_fil_rev_8_21_14_0_10_39_11 TaxID=1974565 RepID=A0A2H0V575_9BACT|nr:MAG: hypothetical protein COT97_02505 [Candidatus Falkowbacteria bacterium CG10_big_fil_rev_8_21_14_0_10_39_11]